MSVQNLELNTVDVLKESVLTAEYARNALARHVAYWVRDSHAADSLPVQQQFLAADARYYDLHKEYVKAVSHV